MKHYFTYLLLFIGLYGSAQIRAVRTKASQTLAVSAVNASVVNAMRDFGATSKVEKAVAIDEGGVIDGNSFCAGKIISKTACSSVSGAVLNDDASTADGLEYDWGLATKKTLGVGFGATTSVRALVEIGGQCWARYNSDVVNSNDRRAVNDGVDRGSSDYYKNVAREPAANEGLLYQWSAAMNGSAAERSQGVCPVGWHIPSDCEWMFLENSLGMSVADQVNIETRTSGSVGMKLKAGGASGFSGLLSGYGDCAPAFSIRGTYGNFWSSSVSGSVVSYRLLFSSNPFVLRYSAYKAYSFSVRCLKD
jgi:uncharacterized protein (TIGR02145 family)